jgi:hypothetical protein
MTRPKDIDPMAAAVAAKAAETDLASAAARVRWARVRRGAPADLHS